MSTILLAGAPRTFAFFAVCLALGSAACASTIVTGGTGSTDDPGGGGTGGYVGGTGGYFGGTGGVAVGGASAVAVPAWMMPDAGSGGCGACGGGAGGQGGYYGGDPHGLTLKVGNTAPTCWSTFSSGCDVVTTWEVKIGLPYAYVGPGTYALTDPAILTQLSAGGAEGGDTCWGMGGSATQGAIQVLSNDGATFVFSLLGMETDSFDPNGTYAAPMCGQY
jgi:hypothetical protein